MYYEERWIDGKFCWRTSPNGAWTAYTANELAHRYQAELQRAHDAQRALDALQAQLADRDAMILQMGEQAAVLAKENMAVKAQLRQVEGQSKQQAEEAVIVFAKYTTLGQLVEALPVVDGRMDVECGACYYIRSFIAGQYGVVCGLITEQSTAMAIKALLEYRATQAAQDAGKAVSSG